jgi:hypothetical protein
MEYHYFINLYASTLSLCGYPKPKRLYNARKTPVPPLPVPRYWRSQRLSNSRLVSVKNRVDLLVELKVEVLTELLLHRSLHSLENVHEHTEASGVLLVVLAALEHTSADKAGVPAVHVSTDDVGRGVVTDHVDVLGQALIVVDLLHPAGNDLVGVLVGSQLGLTVDYTLKIDTSKGLVHGLETDAESTLGHAGEGVLGGAQHISLGEVDGDALGDGVLGAGSEATVLRLEQVHDDLDVGGIVAGVGEDHDGVDVDLGEVARTGSLALLVGEDAVGSDGGVPSNDVVGNNDVFETVFLSDLTALVTLTTNDKDGLVVLGQSTHRSVGLDELVGGNGVVEDLGELLASWAFELTRAVGEEDVRNLDAKFVVSVEDLEGALTLGDQAVTVDEHTVNVEDESHVLCGANLLTRKVLELGSDDVAGRLDSGHTWALGSTLAIGVVD